MQTIKDVRELLARFSNDAIMEDDLDIQGVSPNTGCSVSVVGRESLQDKITELQDEIDDKDTDAKKVTKKLGDILVLLRDAVETKMWRNVHEAITDIENLIE